MAPSFNPETDTITIPRTPGVTYYINGEKVKGSVVIDEETTVMAEPNPPVRFRDGTETEWTFTPGGSTLSPVDEVVLPDSEE